MKDPVLIGIVTNVGRKTLFRRIQVAKCYGCGKTFERKTKKHKFCKPSCYQKLWRENNYPIKPRHNVGPMIKPLKANKEMLDNLEPEVMTYENHSRTLDKAIREAR